MPTQEIPFLCPHCGIGTPIHDARWRRDRCNNCSSPWTLCNRSDHNDFTSPTHHGFPICNRCIDRNGWSVCTQCSQAANFTETVIPAHGDSFRACNRCANSDEYRLCQRCDVYMHPDRATEDYDGNPFCPECSQTLVQCPECDRLLPRNEQCPCNNSGCGCAACRRARFAINQQPPDTGYLNDWSYRPTPVFHGDGPLFLGMELEVETGDHRRTCQDVIRKHAPDNNLLYLKQDGSIDYGFELVTHPMDYSWAIENFPWEMLGELSEAGASTHNRVGLHVHLSRKGFASPAHIYKWMKFIYRNSDRVTTMAGRDSGEWAAFNPDDRENIKHYCKGTHGTGRYRAINTQNTETFEMRMFQSTLNPHRVKAALALANASVQYTRQLSFTDVMNGGWQWSHFYAWLADKPQYVDLRTRMDELSCVS